MEHKRISLIEKLCRLPATQLLAVENLFHRLERDATAVQETHTHWPHAPVHRLAEQGTFMVTASTYQKAHFFRKEEALTLLQDTLLELATEFEIALEAWAIFSNHYHFVAHVASTPNPLADMLTRLHGATGDAINQQANQAGRQVWFNYWDTRLTYQTSYLARLNYVHQNAVKHGIVQVASDYPWCSAAWFEHTASSAQVQTIYSFQTGRVTISDDYEPIVE